jgi:hypothetical protein
MEIVPFLQLNGRRVAVIGGLAGVAVAGAVAFASTRPTEYVASTTVFLDRIYAEPRFELEPKVGNFATTVQFLTVQERVGAEVGMTALQVSGALRATLPDQGTYVDITFRSQDPQQALAGSRAGATESLRELITNELTNAQATLDRAETATDAARASVDVVTAPLGVPDVQAALNAAEATVTQVQLQLPLYGPTSEATRQQLETLLAEKQAEIIELQAVLPEFERVQQRLDKAILTENAAQDVVDQATSRLAAVDLEQAIAPQPAIAQSSTPQMLRYGLAAALAVIGASFALLMIREAMAVRRAGRPGQADDAWSDQPDAATDRSGAAVTPDDDLEQMLTMPRR